MIEEKLIEQQNYVTTSGLDIWESQVNLRVFLWTYKSRFQSKDVIQTEKAQEYKNRMTSHW